MSITRFNHELEMASFSSDHEWSIEEFRQLLTKVEAWTPDEVRSSLRVRLVQDDYENYSNLEIIREASAAETHALQQAELARIAKDNSDRMARERLELERLKRKFGEMA